MLSQVENEQRRRIAKLEDEVAALKAKLQNTYAASAPIFQEASSPRDFGERRAMLFSAWPVGGCAGSFSEIHHVTGVAKQSQKTLLRIFGRYM